MSLAFGREMARAAGDVLNAKIAVMKLDSQIELIDQQIAESRKRVDRFNEELFILLRADIKHPLLSHLREATNFDQKKIGELLASKTTMLEQRDVEAWKCRTLAFSKLKAVQLLTIDLLLCARRELKFPIDEERYAELMKIETAGANDYLHSMLKNFHDQINPPEQGPPKA